MTITAALGAETTDGSSHSAGASGGAGSCLAIIQSVGRDRAALGAVLEHLPKRSGIAWLLLDHSQENLPMTPPLPVADHRHAEGEVIRPDMVSLRGTPCLLSFEQGRWRLHEPRPGQQETSLFVAPADMPRIVHLLLGSPADRRNGRLERDVRAAGGHCMRQDGDVIRVAGADATSASLPLSVFGPWLAQEWHRPGSADLPAFHGGSLAPEDARRADREATDQILRRLSGQQGSSACLIDPDDRVASVFGEHVFVMAATSAGGICLMSLPPAMRIPVAEMLETARTSGTVQRLLHLPFDDPGGETRFVDMAFVPLEPPQTPRPHVLAIAAPSRAMPAPHGPAFHPTPALDAEAARSAMLARQLHASRLQLKIAVERLQLGNERLQAAFDDLKSAHDELGGHAAHQKALTEELVRVDTAHRQKIAELEQLTSDIASLLNSIDVGVVFVDLDLTVRRCAPIAAHMLRLDQPAEGRLLGDITVGLGSADLCRLVGRTLADGSPGELEIEAWEGSRFLVRILAHKNAKAQISGAVVTLIDVTAYHAAELGRAASEERWRRLVDTAPDAVILHEDGIVALANRSALRIMATKSAEDLVGRGLMELISPEGRLSVERQLAKAAVEGVVADPASTAIITLEGRRIEVEITTSAWSDGDRQSFQTVLRDVTDRRRAEAEIKHLVHHDGLTGLPNRTLLLDRLETAMARAARDGRHGALMLLDLDQFKDINDTLGHPAGDRLLQIVARRLRGTLRSTDTLARLGGDEFAIVQTDLASHGGASGAAILAQKALDAIAEPISIDDHDLFVTSSLGVTLFPTDGGGADQLIKNADLALYRAKAEGGHRFQFFLAQMNAEVLQRKSLERELRRAIERGELSLAFQPQFLIGGGRPVGAEALLRWTHPERGAIPPMAFIPVAESTGLIRPLGRWVLEEACHAIRRGVDAGREITIGVNLSAAQLRHGDFVAHLHDLLHQTKIRADLLEIEITESMLFEPSNDAIAEMLRHIARLGVRLAVDDFGTGYSSLAYLKRFPVHKIKIDQSFIRDIGRDKDDDMIVTAMVHLAHSLGKRVIAEGVETQRQLGFLRALGCDEVQGYALARPMPEDALIKLLAES